MNPYLEAPTLWSEFHSRLIVELSNALIPQLRPKYYVGVETRTYIDEGNEDLFVGIPDALILPATSAESPRLAPPTSAGSTANESEVTVQIRPTPVQLPMPSTCPCSEAIEVRERYLEVREVRTNTVVTTIEILSPKNKRSGEGRIAYERKRQRVLGSFSNLVEIDLLRANPPMPMIGHTEPADYRIVVSRASYRPTADLYGFSIQAPIPEFPLPLKPEDAEIGVNLQAIVDQVYEFGSYDLRLDYRQSVPPPALSAADQQWLDALLAPIRA